MLTLFLITARGGSRGIPNKNIKKLSGKPLIDYSINLAKQFTSEENICISTDDKKIVKVALKSGIKVPFLRPKHLATDTASSYDVILHALNWYKSRGRLYERIVLLQPTSPFRLKAHLLEALALYKVNLDLVVSVTKYQSNPFATLFFCKPHNYLEKVYTGDLKSERRQDIKNIFELNGAIYIFNSKSLLTKKRSEFSKVKMFEMPLVNSVDIDTPLDWKWCEFLLKENSIKFDYKV